MITGFFLTILITVVTYMTGLLPSVSLSSGAVSAISLAVSGINAFSFLEPVSTILAVLTLYFFFHATLLAWDSGLWVIHMIRGR